LLKKAGARGVQVKVLTSVEVGEDIVKELVRFAEVRVVREKFMHAKMYIADGKVLIGSANLTCPVLEGKKHRDTMRDAIRACCEELQCFVECCFCS
jgi:HKD family nuclease